MSGGSQDAPTRLTALPEADPVWDGRDHRAVALCQLYRKLLLLRAAGAEQCLKPNSTARRRVTPT